MSRLHELVATPLDLGSLSAILTHTGALEPNAHAPVLMRVFTQPGPFAVMLGGGVGRPVVECASPLEHIELSAFWCGAGDLVPVRPDRDTT